MHMFVRIITLLLLCGFSTSQMPDIAPAVEPVIEQASKHCNGELLAKNEYDHSKIISKEIKTASRMLAALINLASESSVSDLAEKLTNRVQAELNTVVDYQASWKESLKYITHATQLININNSIPYSNDVIVVVEGMRKRNHYVEKIISWVLESYDTIYDCIITRDSNCSIDGKNYVLNDIETTEYADDVTTFREMNPQLLTIYSKTRQQYTLFYSMKLWFRTLKFTNTNFDEATTKWLSDGLELIDAALQTTKHEITNVHKDIKQIHSLIKRVNNDDCEVSELMEYLPTIKSRIPQMDEISYVLRKKVKKMKKHSARIWKQKFIDFAIWPDVADQDKHAISPAYTLRDAVESILSSTSSLSDTAAAKSLTDIKTDYDNDDSAMARCFKSLDAMLHHLSVDLASSLQIVEETLQPTRYLALIKIMKHQKNLADEDHGAIFDVFKRHKKFLKSAKKFFKKLNKHPVALKDYLGKSTDAENSFFTGDLPTDDDVTTFTSLLDQLSKTFAGFLVVLSKTHQSAIYSELVLTYNDESGGTYFDTFEGDELVVEVLEREGGESLQEFMTSMNDYYTSKNIKTFYNRFDQLIDIYDDGYKAFHTHDPDEDRATKMNAIVVRLTTQKSGLSDMTTNGIRFSNLATHTGLTTMRIVSDVFQSPEINEDEYGDFRDSTESPLITTNVTPNKRENKINGDLLSDIVTYPARVKSLKDNSSAVSKHTSKLGQLTAFKLGDASLFETPPCPESCTYRFKFEKLRDAKVAVGCYNERLGTFSETRDAVNGDKSSIFITQNDPSGTVDIVYLDQYNQIYSSHHRYNDTCRIHIALTGTIKFTSDKVTAAVVDIPIDASESVLYNVYNGRTASEFEKKIYVRKGVYLEDENEPWSSLTLTSDDLRSGACIGLGVVRKTVNKYGKVELTGFMYDGNTISFNPDSVCVRGATESENLDSVVDNDDEEDEVLYMYYQAEPVRNSIQISITVKLFSNKKRKGFTFLYVEDFKYAPSYVTLKRSDQVIHVAEPTPLENEPEDMPRESQFQYVCSEVYPCAAGQRCDNSGGCKGASCRSVQEHKIGVCKTKKPKVEPIRGNRVGPI